MSDAAAELHQQTFRVFIGGIQRAGLVPRTTTLVGPTWQAIVVPRPLRTMYVTFDGPSRSLTVRLRRLIRRRTLMDITVSADSLVADVARAVQCVCHQAT